VARTSSLIALVQPILHRVLCSNETLPNAPKHYKMLQNMSLVPMGWIECVLCKKYRCDFRAQTCALIAPVQPVLHRVSCNNETLTNAPKHYENAPKHEFRVKWGGSRVFVAKYSDASSWHELLHYLHQFSLCRTEFHAVTKQSKMHPNTTKRTNS